MPGQEAGRPTGPRTLPPAPCPLPPMCLAGQEDFGRSRFARRVGGGHRRSFGRAEGQDARERLGCGRMHQGAGFAGGGCGIDSLGVGKSIVGCRAFDPSESPAP